MQNKSYYVGPCNICKQGQLEIVKDVDTHHIYICCDECEAEWTTVENALCSVNGTRGKFGKLECPSLEEIKIKGWMEHIKNI